MNLAVEAKPWIKRIAQAGLIAKGVVYILLGALGFMAAFELGGKNNNEASQTGALQALKELPAGTILLALLATGLLCYSIWRGIQTFYNNGKETSLTKRLRYFISGIAYLALAYAAARAIFESHLDKADKNQKLAGELMDNPFGQILVGVAALILAGIGCYQIYYGLSEKYKKHVQELSLGSQHATTLLRAGKIGYISRGIVWLAIAYLFARAALHARSSEAGSTSKAFQVVEATPMGSYLLGFLGLGLIAYGIFNFIRARYERFT